MIRKETLEQNDISIIIGNLPKRLQEKLILREGKSSCNKNDRSKIVTGESSKDGKSNISICDEAKKCDVVNSHFAAPPMVNHSPTLCSKPSDCGTTSNSNSDPLTPINHFLRLHAKRENEENMSEKVKPVLEPSGSLTNSKLKEKKSECHSNIVVPGLIRLNAEDVKKLNECKSQDLKHGLRNHEKRNRLQTRQDMLIARSELPVSPIRHVQKVNHPLWFETLNDTDVQHLPSLFDSLQNEMRQNSIVKNWIKVCKIRQQLQETFKNLLLNYLKFSCEQKVDSFFWKILFYNIREHLKLQPSSAGSINCIQEIIADGIEFYDDLYHKFFENYLVKQTQINGYNIHCSANQQRSQHKMELMAKVTAQKLMICLGDLWRYKVKDINGQDYAVAAKYYKRAQELVPSNGVPYNQLAIVAIHKRKKFDAVYYHMRSLMSSNAIHSAKESLLILFDEIRKKYEETELKSSPLHCSYINNNHQSSKSMRKEVWIYPDGVRRLHRTDLNGNNYKTIINEEKRFKEMPTEELLRRIISLYLYIIGKLFTGVGMETIIEHQRKLLLELSVLFQKESLVIIRTSLLKMLALNIFILEHNLEKDTRRYHAFNFCNQMFGLLLRKSHDLLHTLNTNPEEFEDEHFMDLNSTLQYNRIYVLWLKHHVDIWEPIKNEDHIFINSWLELEKLFNSLQQEDLIDINEQSVVTFGEDIFFMGYTPLSSIVPKVKSETLSEESLQLKARLRVLLDFKEIYCANQKRLENPVNSHFINEDLTLDIKQALDDLQNTQLRKSENAGNENENSDEENQENCEINNIANGEVEKPTENKLLVAACLNSKTEDIQLSHLSKLKRELEAKTHVKKMYHNKLEEILNFVGSKIYIEVRPKYLLPDTNCFIDCLEDFERIVQEFKRYTLVIPLTVVKELDGLSKGVKVDSYEVSLKKQRIHHYDDVSTRAKKSLDFIKSAKSHIKCATTKGSIINSSLFALVEEEHVSNDDKILATAMALSKTMSSETSKDGKCFVQTELVLITTDRNLRVKALSRNLAVSELPEFLQWAQHCN